MVAGKCLSCMEGVCTQGVCAAWSCGCRDSAGPSVFLAAVTAAAGPHAQMRGLSSMPQFCPSTQHNQLGWGRACCALVTLSPGSAA